MTTQCDRRLVDCLIRRTLTRGTQAISAGLDPRLSHAGAPYTATTTVRSMLFSDQTPISL